VRGHNGPKNRQPATGTHHKASISDGGSASRQKGGDGSLDSKEGHRVLVAMTLARLNYATSRSVIQIAHSYRRVTPFSRDSPVVLMRRPMAVFSKAGT